jgi:D-sedoheptulose 7-phosphate isomerase
VLAALHVARAQGGIVIGFSGQTGGKMNEFCTHIFLAPHTSSDRIQEAHILAYHYLCERVEDALGNS